MYETIQQTESRILFWSHSKGMLQVSGTSDQLWNQLYSPNSQSCYEKGGHRKEGKKA